MQFMSQPRLLGHEGLLQDQIKVILKGHHSHCLWVGRIRRFCTPKFLFSSRVHILLWEERWESEILAGADLKRSTPSLRLTRRTQILSKKVGKIIRRVTQLKFLHPETQMQGSGSQFDHLEVQLKQRSLGRSQNVIQEVWGVLWASAFLPSPKRCQCYWSRDLTLRTSDL